MKCTKTEVPKSASLDVLDHCTYQVLLNKLYSYTKTIQIQSNVVMFLLIVINII